MFWFVLSSFVVLNMFIAVITENLEISPENKRKAQIKAFFVDVLNEKHNKNYLKETRDVLIRKFKIKRRTKNIHNGETVFQLLQKDRMDNFLSNEDNYGMDHKIEVEEKNSRSLLKTIIEVPSRIINPYLEKRRAQNIDNPFHDPNEIKGYENRHHPPNTESMVTELIRTKNEIEKQQREYLEKHPDSTNRSLKIFGPNHPLRVLCQKIVAPSYGTRIEGTNPRPIMWYMFSIAMLLSTVGLVVIAVIVTPIYYKELIDTHPGMNWFILADAMFVGIFSLESIIKIIADGLYFTPNAYLRSVWGIIDFGVLITLWVNLIQQVTNHNKASRLIRAFKALRALRLLSFSSKAQELFHNVIYCRRLETIYGFHCGIWPSFSVLGLGPQYFQRPSVFLQ